MNTLKQLGFVALLAGACALSVVIAVVLTLWIAKSGPEGPQGERGPRGLVGPRGYPGESEAGENAEADVINLEGTVRELEGKLEEVGYQAEEATHAANEAKSEAEGACYAAGKIVC